MTRARRIGLPLAALVALGCVVGYLAWLRPFLDRANVGMGFVAKQMCSCIFVAQRSFESCRPDQFASMDRIEAETVDEPPGVRSWLPWIGERHAVYHGELGCALVD